MTMLRIITIGFLLLFATTGALQANDWADGLVRQAQFKYHQLEGYNDRNQLLGKAHLNEYVIELDPEWTLDPNWIEEKGNGKKLLPSKNYEVLSRMLRDFNEVRKDDLRFYVIVINDYQVQIHETIDLSRVRGVVDDLHDLVSFPDAEKDYERFKDEIGNIPERISDALHGEGHENRLVYFYGQIRLFKLDQKGKFFKHDNLSIDGPEISKVDQQLREAAKKAVSKDDYAEEQIEGLVAGIINAVHVIIDEPDENVPLVDCGDSFEQLLSKTSAHKEKSYAASVSSVAELLDAPAAENRVGSEYFIVDQPENIDPEDLFTSSILPDKLSLLAAGNSDYKLYVVYKAVDFILETSEWKDFAKAVYEKSSTAKSDPNTIIVVVPYYETICVGQSWLFPVSKHTGLLMPGVYCGDEGLRTLMNSAVAGIGGTWEANFRQAFKYIPKRYVTFDYKFLWNGDLIIDGKTDRGTRADKEDIFEVRILEDERFNKLESAWDEYYAATVGLTAGGSASQTMTYTQQQFDQILEAGRAYGLRVSAILNERPQFYYVTKTNLVESKVTSKVSDEFVKWYAAHKKWGFATYFNSPADDLFYGGRNPEKIEDGLMLIDIGSGLASFIGADAIFDGLGAYYAYSNGKYTAAVFYTGAATVPFWSSAVRRAVMEGGAYMLKTAKGTIVSMPRGVLGMNYLFEIKDVFSPFMKTALDIQPFSRAAKYKSDGVFIEAMEDGMIADSKAITALNDSPELVDDFYRYHADTRGDLKTFLDEYKVGGKVSSANLLQVSWKNNITGHRSSTDALKFWNNASKEYRHLIDGDLYIKFDMEEGYLLFGNHQTEEILGFYEGIENTGIVTSQGLEKILGKLRIYHGVDGPSYVVMNVSSGARIIASPGKTATIIGNYGFGDMRILVTDELLANLKTQQFAAKEGGFNVLNVSDDLARKSDDFWEDFNRPWLQAAINRGDDIWVATDPMDLSLLIKGRTDHALDFDHLKRELLDPVMETEDLSGFGKEVKLLIESGYTFDGNLHMFVK